MEDDCIGVFLSQCIVFISHDSVALEAKKLKNLFRFRASVEAIINTKKHKIYSEETRKHLECLDYSVLQQISNSWMCEPGIFCPPTSTSTASGAAQSSAHWNVTGSIPVPLSLHVKVSAGKILNLKLLLMLNYQRVDG